MSLPRLFRCMPLAIAFVLLAAPSNANAASLLAVVEDPPTTNTVSACVAAGSAMNAAIAPNTALNAGANLQFTCTVTAGTNYNIRLDYDQGAVTPGDAGNYIGFQLYRVNADDTTTLLRTSSPDGNDRETTLKSADGDETWFLKVENLASSPAYNTGVGLNVYIPGGQE